MNQKAVLEMKINNDIQQYITTNVLPQYSDDTSGHGIAHIEYVMRRCKAFADQLDGIDPDVLYTAAAYHDLAHKIDKRNHETLSAQIFLQDEAIKQFFTDDEIIIIREAIEDHRASADHKPRSVYGEILSSADRSTSVNEFLQRTHQYTLKHFPESTQAEILDRAINHASEKYGSNGYAKHYLPDPEYDDFIKEMQLLLNDTERFTERYLKVNK